MKIYDEKLHDDVGICFVPGQELRGLLMPRGQLWRPALVDKLATVHP